MFTPTHSFPGQRAQVTSNSKFYFNFDLNVLSSTVHGYIMRTVYSCFLSIVMNPARIASSDWKSQQFFGLSVMRLILKTASVTLDCFYVFNIILSFSTCNQTYKKICTWEIFGANVLKQYSAKAAQIAFILSFELFTSLSFIKMYCRTLNS